ncbi:hypothetical protein M1437_04235 [Patescibacteria group bacterium]|nr:hypothetical protein [Patescibacteria group bacterium]
MTIEADGNYPRIDNDAWEEKPLSKKELKRRIAKVDQLSREYLQALQSMDPEDTLLPEDTLK